MITTEMLAADAALQGLTDEQRSAIVLMSKNDEEVVIGNRFREVYNQLDATIARETGIARNGDEKTYLYLERAAKTLAAKANSVDGLNAKVNDLTKERDRLQKALEEGGDDTVKKQLAQAQRDLAGAKEQFNTLKTQFDDLQKTHAQEVLNIRIDNELATATAGLKFKAEIPQTAADTLLKQAIATVKSMNPQYVDDGNGGQRLVFRNGQGQTLQNAENHLEPFTAAELVQRELRQMGILDEGRRQNGGGTQPPQGNQDGSAHVTVAMARTQEEAYDIIAKQLMQRGLVNGSNEFQEAMNTAWKEHSVQSLPVE